MNFEIKFEIEKDTYSDYRIGGNMETRLVSGLRTDGSQATRLRTDELYCLPHLT